MAVIYVSKYLLFQNTGPGAGVCHQTGTLDRTLISYQWYHPVHTWYQQQATAHILVIPRTDWHLSSANNTRTLSGDIFSEPRFWFWLSQEFLHFDIDYIYRGFSTSYVPLKLRHLLIKKRCSLQLFKQFRYSAMIKMCASYLAVTAPSYKWSIPSLLQNLRRAKMAPDRWSARVGAA